MQITKITPQIIQNYKLNQNNVTNPTKAEYPTNLSATKLPIPTATQFLAINNPAFCGGYSLNLAETVANLDRLTERYPNIYPKNVREWIGMILENGSDTKDTLISVHKKLYANIKDCFSLEELKAKFPEFKDVKSVNDVEAKEGSFLSEIINGQNDIFNGEEDLSLQLIKLYWAEGFSLNDLRAYAGNRDLNGIMNKLNIPKVNKNYGHILKLSDPEYNERLTSQMTIKRREAMDIRAQKQDGEPVYIPRKPLSPEHKQHISEGLIKYYIEHPEKTAEMSERQKKFFEDNPEQAQMFQRVMKKAWNAFGADRIKKALSKFLKQEHAHNFSEQDMMYPDKMSKEQSALMKKFWGINEWARKQFSKNVEYGWKKVKEEQDMFYKFDVTPERFKQRFYDWCDERGLDETATNMDNFKYYPHRPELNQLDTRSVSKYTPQFIDGQKGDESAKLANTYQRTLAKFGKELKKFEKATNVPQETKDLALVLRKLIHQAIIDDSPNVMGIPMAKILDAQEVQSVYISVLLKLMNNHETGLVNKLNRLLNESYNYLDTHWQPGQVNKVVPDFFDF